MNRRLPLAKMAVRLNGAVRVGWWRIVMSDNQVKLALELIRPIIDAWAQRDERSAAKEAGKLTFWRDGMLRQLETIADGRATKRTFEDLRKNFDETADRVNKTMEKLAEVRGKL